LASETVQFDTGVNIITPENITFQYRLAGPFRRIWAYLIDCLIVSAVYLVVAIILSMGFGFVGFEGIGSGLIYILLFVLSWFYSGMFEALWNGQTPGKRLMHIRVITVEGQPIRGWQATLRNFLRAADCMPPLGRLIGLYQAGFWSAAMTPRFQRLGDLASGTMVVVEEPQRHFGVAKITEPEAIRLSGLIPAGFKPSRSLGRALSIYVQRRQLFAWRRRAEIAMHLAEPLRIKFDLPPGTSHDMLLCALYLRTYVADRPDEDLPQNPFAPPQPENPFVLQTQSPGVQPMTYSNYRR
jgi:uncharacterized RDD family membrane protein YckC